MHDSIKEYLESIANNESVGDKEDFDAQGHGGGNFDDAYQLGVNDGQVFLAQHLLATYWK